MSVNGLGTPLSALQANQFRVDVTANNIANVNTDGFQASSVATADRAYINDIGQGTQVTATYQPARPGPVAVDTAAPGGMVEQSNTDLVNEMTNLMSAQNAYGVNTSMSRSVDEATQTILDLKG